MNIAKGIGCESGNYFSFCFYALLEVCYFPKEGFNPKEISVQVTKKKTENATEIFVEGSIDTMSSPKLLEFAEGIIASGESNIVVDFKGVDYVSSAGLKVFLSLSRLLEKKGSLVLRNMNSSVKKVFDITGFMPLFNIR